MLPCQPTPHPRHLPLKRRIYDYIGHHWADWLPFLPSYQAFNHRLSHLTLAFQTLIGQYLSQTDQLAQNVLWLGDRLSTMLSYGPISPGACVAYNQANLNYRAAKSQYSHSVKLHVLARRRPGLLPVPEWLFLTPASCYDLTATHKRLPLQAVMYYTDKAYADRPQHQQAQDSKWLTPFKAVRGQYPVVRKTLRFRFVSAIRLPIKSFSND